MSLSFLQLNMNSDNYWDVLIPYLASHNFDIMHFQEVTGKNTISGNINCKIDVFEALQKVLGDTYNSELAISTRFTSGPSSYIGNATFYKKEFSLVSKNIVTLYEGKEPFPSEATNYGDEGRNLLHLTLTINNKNLSFLNTHGAWAPKPIEQPYQTQQGDIVVNYLKQLSDPFIFSADMNLMPGQPLIQKLSMLAHNLTEAYKVTNTLNPRTHRAQELFPSGHAVDYIFVSRELTVKKFAVIEEDLSDHFGLTAEIEI